LLNPNIPLFERLLQLLSL